jgi:hypothetical protein
VIAPAQVVVELPPVLREHHLLMRLARAITKSERIAIFMAPTGMPDLEQQAIPICAKPSQCALIVSDK